MKRVVYFTGFACVIVIACGRQTSNDTGATAGSQPDGKALFMGNCASCHNMVKDATGPALANALSRWGNDTAKLAAFIKDPTASINQGGPGSYQAKLYEQWHKITMPSFHGLSDAEISAIIRILK